MLRPQFTQGLCTYLLLQLQAGRYFTHCAGHNLANTWPLRQLHWDHQGVATDNRPILSRPVYGYLSTLLTNTWCPDCLTQSNKTSKGGNFCEWLAHAIKGCHAQNFVEKTVANSHSNSQKFSPWKVSRYTCTYMENRTEAKINSSGKLLVVYRNDNTPFSETAARLSPVFSSLSLTPVATSDDIATSVPRTSVTLATSVPCISDNTATSVPRTSVGTVTSFLRISDGNATSVFLTSAGTVTSILLTSDCCSCCGWVRSVP